MTFSQQIRTSKSDEYYTPAYAVRIIIPYLKTKVSSVFGVHLIKNRASLSNY